MKAYQGFIVVMSLAAVMIQPSVAAAQSSTAELPIAVGKKITVTTGDGRKTNGKVLSLTPTTVEIGEGEKVKASIALSDVQRVQASDPVNNGVITGALTLGLVGALWGALGDGVSDLASGIFTGKSAGTNYTLIGSLAGVGLGAVLGYALDAGKEKTIYDRKSLGMSVQVRPIVSAAGKGLGVSVRW